VRFQKLQCFLCLALGLTLVGCKHPEPVKAPYLTEIVVAASPMNDAFWLNLDRRRSDKYRQQLKVAPPVLVIRESHYTFNSANGIGIHYGWLDGRLANLHITFSELVANAYGKDYAHTEFPETWTQGHWTNCYDVICTLTNQPQTALPAAARTFLKQHCGLAWHPASRESEVLLIRAQDPALLQTRATTDFSQSKAISDLAGELENYFGKPVVDETGATGRFDKKIGEVPARWVNGRTTDLAANNNFLATFGLELVPATRPQKWLVLDPAK